MSEALWGGFDDTDDGKFHVCWQLAQFFSSNWKKVEAFKTLFFVLFF